MFVLICYVVKRPGSLKGMLGGTFSGIFLLGGC